MLHSFEGDKEAEGRNVFLCMSVHDPDPNRSSMQLVFPQQMTLKVPGYKSRCKNDQLKGSSAEGTCRTPGHGKRPWHNAV